MLPGAKVLERGTYRSFVHFVAVVVENLSLLSLKLGILFHLYERDECGR